MRWRDRSRQSSVSIGRLKIFGESFQNKSSSFFRTGTLLESNTSASWSFIGKFQRQYEPYSKRSLWITSRSLPWLRLRPSPGAMSNRWRPTTALVFSSGKRLGFQRGLSSRSTPTVSRLISIRSKIRISEAILSFLSVPALIRRSRAPVDRIRSQFDSSRLRDLSGAGTGPVSTTTCISSSRFDFVAAASPVAIFLFLAYHRPVATCGRFNNSIFRGSSAVEQVAVAHGILFHVCQKPESTLTVPSI